MSEILDHNGTQSSQPDEMVAALSRANAALRAIPGTAKVPEDLQLEVEAIDNLLKFDVLCVFSGLCQVVRSDGLIEVKPKMEEAEAVVGDTNGFWITQFGSEGRRHWAVGWGFEVVLDDTCQPPIVAQYFMHTGVNYEVVPLGEIEAVLRGVVE